LLPRVKVWLEVEGHFAFGTGMAQVLQAVERTGSIKAAAAELGQSYRHIWGRVKDAERAVGRPLVVAHVGGSGVRRSSLTPLARRLVADFLALRARLTRLLQTEYADQFPLPPG
jgi:molybdate transport system regulatory protein